MWYVVQTIKGREYKDLDRIREEVTEVTEEAFVIENERQFRIDRKWVKVREPLFPGYIFVESDDAYGLIIRLHKSKIKLHLVEMDGVPAVVRKEEEEYLRRIAGDDRIVRYSEGIRIGDQIVIEHGAFAGYTGEIRKLDRHNRWASIVLPIMGRDMEVKIGLGIVKVASGS